MWTLADRVPSPWCPPWLHWTGLRGAAAALEEAPLWGLGPGHSSGDKKVPRAGWVPASASARQAGQAECGGPGSANLGLEHEGWPGPALQHSARWGQGPGGRGPAQWCTVAKANSWGPAVEGGPQQVRPGHGRGQVSRAEPTAQGILGHSREGSQPPAPVSQPPADRKSVV